MPQTSQGPLRSAAGGSSPPPVVCTHRSTHILPPRLQGGVRRGWKNKQIKTARRRESVKEVTPFSLSPSLGCL